MRHIMAKACYDVPESASDGRFIPSFVQLFENDFMKYLDSQPVVDNERAKRQQDIIYG